MVTSGVGDLDVIVVDTADYPRTVDIRDACQLVVEVDRFGRHVADSPVPGGYLSCTFLTWTRRSVVAPTRDAKGCPSRAALLSVIPAWGAAPALCLDEPEREPSRLAGRGCHVDVHVLVHCRSGADGPGGRIAGGPVAGARVRDVYRVDAVAAGLVG